MMAAINNLLNSALMVILLVLGLGGFMVALGTQYGVPVQNIDSSGALAQTFNQTEQIRTQLESSTTTSDNILNLVIVSLNSIVQVGKLMFSIPSIFTGLITGAFGLTGGIVPGYVANILLAAITISVILAVVYLYQRVKP